MTNNYYQENKEKFSRKACKRYQNLSEKEKDKNHQYARERYKNLSEEKRKRSISMVGNDEKYFTE